MAQEHCPILFACFIVVAVQDCYLTDKDGFVLDPNDDVDQIFGASSLEVTLIKRRKSRIQSILSYFSQREQTLRQELAAAYRMFDKMGWTDTIYGHLTVRVPDENDPSKKQFLINPFGLLYSEISASSLIKLDLDGNVIHPGTTNFPHNDAGYVIHSALHSAVGRDMGCEIECVMHCHFSDGIAVSCLREGLIPELCQTAQILGPITYHSYEGIAVDRKERARLQHDLGPRSKVMILRNHGLVTCGKSIGEAFLLMFYLVEACKNQIRAMSAVGGDVSRLMVPVEEIARKTYKIAHGFNREGFGQRELDAYMRYLDTLDPTYRL